MGDPCNWCQCDSIGGGQGSGCVEDCPVLILPKLRAELAEMKAEVAARYSRITVQCPGCGGEIEIAIVGPSAGKESETR